jgi:hypothetical protein
MCVYVWAFFIYPLLTSPKIAKNAILGEESAAAALPPKCVPQHFGGIEGGVLQKMGEPEGVFSRK